MELDLNHIHEIEDMFKKLFPICRSITGNGVRQTLSILKNITNFKIIEIPSGTICYDWTIPNEWNINDAYVEDHNGIKIIDFKKNNLHVVNYSTPVNSTFTFNQLEKHLHVLPDYPDAIPYRTSYYKEEWGFCLTYKDFKKMDRNGSYKVRIDSTLKPGNLTYGEYLIEGTSGKEFIISTYCCHPSLANDNLSGPILWTLLLRKMKSIKTKHSYRFIIVPETIGAITYLSKNEEEMKKIHGGFIITCVAGPGKFSYKETFVGNHAIDNMVRKVFSELELELKCYNFDIEGSDEVHYSCPFFRIPIGTICKDKYHEYEYYHTSKDNLEFISANSLLQTLQIYNSVINELENTPLKDLEKNNNGNILHTKEDKSIRYKSLNPYCIPMLSKRGLYPTLGGKIKQKAASGTTDHSHQEYRISDNKSISGTELDAMIWIMFYSDGQTSLFEISNRSKIPLDTLNRSSKMLLDNNLLEIVY